jgi:hypothetical protein
MVIGSCNIGGEQETGLYLCIPTVFEGAPRETDVSAVLCIISLLDSSRAERNKEAIFKISGVFYSEPFMVDPVLH